MDGIHFRKFVLFYSFVCVCFLGRSRRGHDPKGKRNGKTSSDDQQTNAIFSPHDWHLSKLTVRLFRPVFVLPSFCSHQGHDVDFPDCSRPNFLPKPKDSCSLRVEYFSVGFVRSIRKMGNNRIDTRRRIQRYNNSRSKRNNFFFHLFIVILWKDLWISRNKLL